MDCDIKILPETSYSKLNKEIQDYLNKVNEVAEAILIKYGIVLHNSDKELEEMNDENDTWYNYIYKVKVDLETAFKLNCEFAEYFESKSLSKLTGNQEVTFMFEAKEEKNARSTKRPFAIFGKHF